MRTGFLLIGFGLGWAIAANAAEKTLHTFRKIRLTPEFWAEGAHVGDFNRDGKLDVAYGPFWFAGPDFQARHEYRPATNSFTVKTPDGSEKTIPGYEGALGSKNAYSDCFFMWTGDFNGDDWADILIAGIPGEQAWWFENPQDQSGHWKRHLALDVADNESPDFKDLTGDGKPELVCNSKGFFGFAAPDLTNPTAPWKFRPITPNKNYHRFTHGLGVGDVNGDERPDLLESNGWWEQPSSLAGDPEWTFYAYTFCPSDPGVPVGGAQLFAYDVNGDGWNDVITCLAAHGYGLAWYEQTRDGGRISFKPHVFMNKQPADNKYGVKFTQPHALDLADMDGDGVKDLVTGKRFWAHGPDGDPEPNAPAVLYWFKLARGAGGVVDWVPYLIDSDSGVGTQVLARDVNGDGWPDIVVGSKKGAHVFLQELRKVSAQEWEAAQPKPLAVAQ